MSALLPGSEAETSTAVCQSHISVADKESFDDFVSLAARLCEAPISLVTTSIANGHQCLASQVGLTLPAILRNDVFSAHTILQPRLFIVRDASADERFSTNPLVTADPRVRFYAGVSLVATDGCALGTLAVMDCMPRELSREQQESLRALARQVVRRLELQHRLTSMESVIVRQREIEKTLRESVCSFRELYDEVPIGYHELNAQGRITRVNRTELQMLGYTSEEMLGRYVWEFAFDQEASRGAVIAKIAGSVALCPFERTVRRKDGTTFPALIEDRLLYNARGDTIGIRSTLQDISERKRTENALRESEERHRTLIKSLPQRLLFKDCQSVFVSVNASLADDLNMRPEDLIGKTDYDLFPKELADKYRADDLRVMHTRQPEMLEETNIVQGRERIVEMVKTPVISDEGDVMGVLGLFTDITDRKQAEAALKESQAWLTTIFEASRDGIVVEENEIIVYGNKSFAHLYGYDKAEELIGKPTSIVQTAEDNERIIEFGRKRLHGEPTLSVYEFKGIQKDGTVIDAEAAVSTFCIADKSYIITSVRNIVERKRVEEKLRIFTSRLEQSNRELQDFASVASHDLQEPLRKIQAFGDRLKIKCADSFSTEGRDYLERMQNAAKRMQTLINDLLMFSRVTTKAQPFVPTDLAEIAREVLADLEVRVEETGGRVELGELPTIDADALQMRQLFQNLIGNALKFRRPEASSVVKVHGEIFRPPAGDEIEESSPDEVCQITVEDNGIGFDEKYLDRIFIVFQRLHGRGEYEGTGVGLAVCRKIVERHGGRITAKSTPGEGVTFLITLPVKQQKGLGGDE